MAPDDLKKGQMRGEEASRIVDEAMTRLGMEDAEFLFRTGLSRQTLYRWREDKSNPANLTVARAIQALGLDPSEWGLRPTQVITHSDSGDEKHDEITDALNEINRKLDILLRLSA